MRSLASMVLAGLMASSALTAATSTAIADGRHHAQFRAYPGVKLGAAVAAGAFLGFAFGALAAPRYVPPPYYPYPPAYAYPPPPPRLPPLPIVYPRLTVAHIAWCKSHYPWYDPATNTWTDQYGIKRLCIAPF